MESGFRCIPYVSATCTRRDNDKIEKVIIDVALGGFEGSQHKDDCVEHNEGSSPVIHQATSPPPFAWRFFNI